MVGLVDEAVDGGLKLDDRAEDAPFEAFLGELGEEAFDSVEPGAGGRREVEDEARMTPEPGHHLGVLVSGVVVEDEVDQLARRHVFLDGFSMALRKRMNS